MHKKFEEISDHLEITSRCMVSNINFFGKKGAQHLLISWLQKGANVYESDGNQCINPPKST